MLIDMAPGRFNLELYRGDTHSWQFSLWEDVATQIPVDLATVTPKAEIRDRSAGRVYATLTSVVTLPNLILVTLSAMHCRGCPAEGVWDLQLTYSNGEIHTVVAGSVVTIGDVTDSGSTVGNR